VRLYAFAALVAALVTFVMSFVINRLSLRFRLYPKIRERDVHTRPTPRLGGVAMFFGVVVAFGLASQFSSLGFLGSADGLGRFDLIFSEPGKIVGLLSAALLIVLIGVVDDIWDLEWWTKLAGQMIAGGILALSGVQIYTIPLPGQIVILPTVMSIGITVLAVVLVMNAVNFIDGLDGLVAGVAIIANVVFFAYAVVLSYNVANTEYFNLAALISAVVIGVCAGFLPFNFHPARMFMGDSGALLVGLLMSASALTVTGSVDTATWYGGQLFPAFIPILLPVAILILPLLDFALAVLRRLRAGKSPFAADRLHLHHRLLDIGHSHLQAVLIFYGWTAIISVGCLAFVFIPWGWAAVILVVGVILCAWGTLVPLLQRNPVTPGAPGNEETDPAAVAVSDRSEDLLS
jgi:UDP-GlcNAc:undecaprenyl-phosphate GlcNAc-1-phosphate transferase